MKKIVFYALAAVISISTVLGFAGCNVENNNSVKDPDADANNPNTPVDPDKPPITDDGKEEEAKKEFEAAKTNFNAFVTSLQAKKFACDVEKFNTSIIVNENVIKMNDVFYENAGDVQFEYQLKEDGQYHKTVYDVQENTNQFVAVDDMLGDFGGVSWTTLNENKVLEGNFADKPVTYQQKDGVHHFTVDGVEYKYHDIGITISLPDKVIDDTKAPVVSDKLYDEQGNLNYVVLADVLKEVKNDERLKKILYIDVSDEGVKFGTYIVNDGKPAFQKYKIIKAIWDRVKTAETKESLIAELNKINRPIDVDGNVVAEYTTEDYTAEQKTQFDAMTKNIFAKLDIEGLDAENVKFGFKTPQGSSVADVGYVYGAAWDHYYIVEIGGQLEFVKINISASTHYNGGTVNNVMNNTQYWTTYKDTMKRTVLQKGNEDLYNTNSRKVELTL